MLVSLSRKKVLNFQFQYTKQVIAYQCSSGMGLREKARRLHAWDTYKSHAVPGLITFLNIPTADKLQGF